MEEARHLAKLRHPNIVSIHEIGQAADEPYFTMDYVAGTSLARKIEELALWRPEAGGPLQGNPNKFVHSK